MARSRVHSNELEQLARLQLLRTARARAELARALAAQREADDVLRSAERERDTARHDLALALRSDILDPDRVVRLKAILDLCDRGLGSAQRAAAFAAEREGAARREWHAADRRQERLRDLHRTARKSEARKRGERLLFEMLENRSTTVEVGLP